MGKIKYSKERNAWIDENDIIVNDKERINEEIANEIVESLKECYDCKRCKNCSLCNITEKYNI